MSYLNDQANVLIGYMNKLHSNGMIEDEDIVWIKKIMVELGSGKPDVSALELRIRQLEEENSNLKKQLEAYDDDWDMTSEELGEMIAGM